MSLGIPRHSGSDFSLFREDGIRHPPPLTLTYRQGRDTPVDASPTPHRLTP